MNKPNNSWIRFDEDDEQTWPSGSEPVIALMQWTKLRFKTPDGQPAPFFQGFIGRFARCDDGEVRFLLDHGNGTSDEPGDPDEDFVDHGTIKWWSYISLPDAE